MTFIAMVEVGIVVLRYEVFQDVLHCICFHIWSYRYVFLFFRRRDNQHGCERRVSPRSY